MRTGEAGTGAPVHVAALAGGSDLREAAKPAARGSNRLALGIAAIATTAAVAAVVMAIGVRQRLEMLEQALVKRQEQSQSDATESKLLARQAQELARDAAARIALLDAKVAETALQRSQLEDLMQQLSRSRDENLVADIEAALRVAVQQTALTGSAEPLASALRQADERLSRINQPRLDRLRRAVNHDLDRVKALVVSDINALTIKVDEVFRQVDDLPLVNDPDRHIAPPVRRKASAPSAAAAASAAPRDWSAVLGQGTRAVFSAIWDEAKSLVRVTPIAHPEAALVSPEQSYFLRENLKLRLLDARLALLSRQFDAARSDLSDAERLLDRYFDLGSKRVGVALDLVRQTAAQAKLVNIPRPDESLAAIAAIQAGR